MSTPFLLFNDVGGSEIVLIFLIVLIFFGPKSIPGIAKTIGRALYSIRNASDELKREIKKAGVDVKKDLNLDAIIQQEEEVIQGSLDQTFSGIDHSVYYVSESTEQTVKIQTTVRENSAATVNSAEKELTKTSSNEL